MHATTRQIALWLLLSVSAAAQQIDDPANLMGERVAAPALADTLPIDHGSPALEQLLRKLRTRASMMLIVAHPDDEDGGLLTYESRGMGARVAMLTLTRGEGGQNLMSADFNDALGLIRTQELLAADRYMGVDQMFGTEVDFGFSKTKEETFKQWGHDRVLYDAVRAVRLYRPLVLASVFVGGVTDGHGHHQVAGEICQEVFKAAADPKVFPEMGLPPWAPLRVYARVPFARVTSMGMFDYATGRWSPPKFHNYVTGEDITHEPAATVTIHEGDKPGIPAFEGDSYVQFARRGLAMQKSQIGSNVRVPPAGVFDVGYTLMASRTRCAAKPGAPCLDSEVGASAQPNTIDGDLFSGIDTSLPAIADLAPDAPASLRAGLVAIDGKIAEAQKLYDPKGPAYAAPALLDAMTTLNELNRQIERSELAAAEKFDVLHELRVKHVQLNDALVLAYRIEYRASVAKVGAEISVPIVAASPVEISTHLTAGSGGLVADGHSLHPHTKVERKLRTSVPLMPGPDESRGIVHYLSSGPYFNRPSNQQPYYNVQSASLRNAPQTPAPFVATQVLSANGVDLEVRAVATQGDSAIPGERLQAAEIVPRLSIELAPMIAVIPIHKIQPLDLTVVLKTNVDRLTPRTDLSNLPRRWILAADKRDPVLRLREPYKFTVKITPIGITPAPTLQESAPRVQAYLSEPTAEGRTETSLGYLQAGYAGLPYTSYYTTAAIRFIAVDVTTAPNLRVAYLSGTGDEVAQFLPSLGVTPTILTPKDLTAENLKQYDAVVLGVRAYAAHPELSGAGSKPLNDYAAQGGVVIVQYNSGGFDPVSAPFPYQLPGDSAHNVVEEAQPVTLLKPDAPLLTWPNRITSADFDGWIEERGHGFASDWAPEFEALLETHDVDQDPQKGGLLVAKTGKGAYIYCALALYRQLPEGVPGAYRLTANLLSYAKNPHR